MIMNNEMVTFERMPEAVGFLIQEIASIKEIVSEIVRPETQDYWMNLNELRAYLPERPAKQTIYSWIRNGYLPAHKGAQKFSFLKSEIDNWLLSRRKLTNEECALVVEKLMQEKNNKRLNKKL